MASIKVATPDGDRLVKTRDDGGEHVQLTDISASLPSGGNTIGGVTLPGGSTTPGENVSPPAGISQVATFPHRYLESRSGTGRWVRERMGMMHLLMRAHRTAGVDTSLQYFTPPPAIAFVFNLFDQPVGGGNLVVHIHSAHDAADGGNDWPQRPLSIQFDDGIITPKMHVVMLSPWSPTRLGRRVTEDTQNQPALNTNRMIEFPSNCDNRTWTDYQMAPLVAPWRITTSSSGGSEWDYSIGVAF